MQHPLKNWKFSIILILSLAVVSNASAGDLLIFGEKFREGEDKKENKVVHQCLKSDIQPLKNLSLEREKPWSLPKKALHAGDVDTLNVLVLRYNFQFETVNDPNTTGRGHFDLSDDSAAFYNANGYYVDPPPHNSDYFNAHMRALNRYYETVSDSHLSLKWDIYPAPQDSAYELPHQMNYYGPCSFDSVVIGLENFFVDCIQLADVSSPEIVFDEYDAIIIFHAGSDQQNNIGFPETCSDLFTGFISFGDSVLVDNGTNSVRTALLMPETSSQDNRATTLNAVMAHEFGHALGLPDLYSTATFMSQLGDFALMDNNGFSTGIDFGFEVGRVFGAMPLFPIAWCRAYLGYVEVVDFRQGSDIRLVAAEIVSDGIKIARIPISENEYYLLENRIFEVDGFEETGAQLDSTTNVILGPAYRDPFTQLITPSREYDFLMPGSGVLIYHVDEKVAGLDYDYDGLSNFEDNDLQWAWDIFGNRVDRFIRIVEADGFVNFGGYYRAGYGKADDMYRDDRNNSLTPNSNPQAVDNTGNNTHLYITDISRLADPNNFGLLMDSVITFNVETDKLVEGFPVWVGHSVFPISPIVDDIDGDGNDEIICVAKSVVAVFTTEGKNFLREYTDCSTCPVFTDSSINSVNSGQLHEIPLYVKPNFTIKAGPVTGRFSDDPDTNKLVAVASDDTFIFYRLADNRNNIQNGQADLAGGPGRGFWNLTPYDDGNIIAMTFGEDLYVLTDTGQVIYKENFNTFPVVLDTIDAEQFLGLARAGDGIVVMAGDAVNTNLYFISPTDTDSISLDGYYVYGPISVDVNLDGINEIVAGSENGDIILVSFDPQAASDRFSVFTQRSFSYELTTNPIAADINYDGYPEIIFGGKNAVYAFNYQLTPITSFPITVNDRYPNDFVVSSPIVADIDRGESAEIIFPTANGNIYSHNPDEATFGFPLSAGEMGIGSPVFVNDSTGGKIGYLGLDGWFYLWHVDIDSTKNFWAMNGGDPGGSFKFDDSKLPALKNENNEFDENKFYNYPNPISDGYTTLRYYLNKDASAVNFSIYDLSGEEIAFLSGPTVGMVDNELVWNCSSVTPGVYRCIIKVDYGDDIKTAFCDIAIIK